MHPKLELTAAEADFLRAWVWEEANSLQVRAPGAKATQVEKAPHSPPILADIVSAAMTPEEQTAMAGGPPATASPPWPWMSEEHLRARHQEAKQCLQHRFTRSGGVREREVVAMVVAIRAICRRFRITGIYPRGRDRPHPNCLATRNLTEILKPE